MELFLSQAKAVVIESPLNQNPSINVVPPSRIDPRFMFASVLVHDPGAPFTPLTIVAAVPPPPPVTVILLPNEEDPPALPAALFDPAPAAPTVIE
jgi:hypothetical protein